MTSPRQLLIGAALVAMGWSALASAQTSDITRITRVVQQPPAVQGNATYVNSLSPRHLNKFIDDSSCATVRFDVEWQASSAGVPAGAAIVLDYRFGKSLETHSLRSGSDSRAKGKHATTFYVQLPPNDTNGQDIAWRARILLDRTILAGRQSTLWR